MDKELNLLKAISLEKEEVNEETNKILEEFIKLNIIVIKDSKYKLNSNYKIGEVIYQRGSYYLKVHSNISSKNIIINTDNDDLTLSSNDFVLAKRRVASRAQVEVKVIKILQKALKTELLLYKDNQFISFKDKSSYKDLILGLEEGSVVNYNFENNEYEIVGNINNPKIDKTISLKLFKKRDFDYSSCEEELKQLEANFADFFEKETSKRKDLTHLNFCTIDPKGAKDHDDAIYYDDANKTLYVAIADVSTFVKPGTNLDKEARQRAFSIYFPNSNIPMLPPLLSENYCSLVPNEDRLAYVFRLKIDEKLNIKKASLYEAVIQVKQKYTYNEVDKFLATSTKKLKNLSSSDKKIIKYLKPLYELTSLLRKKRLKKGLDFDNSDIKLNLNHNEELQSVFLEKSTASHSLIEECMLLANQASANITKEEFNDKGIYRVHSRVEYAKLVELVDNLQNLEFDINFSSALHLFIANIQKEALKLGYKKEVDRLLIQSQKQANYQSNVNEHFGLGFEYYSHFTSPIRRYSDLVLHRILKTNQLPIDIEEICDEISSKEREITKLEFDYRDRKFARWALKNVDKTFSGLIIDTNLEHLIVELDGSFSGIKVIVDDICGLKLFDKVNVKILSSDLLTKEIKGMIY